MILEDEGRLAHGVLGRDAAVRPELENQPLGPGLPLGGLHLEVHGLHGREVRVHRERVDRQGLRLALVGGDVAAALLDVDLHLEGDVALERGERLLGIEDHEIVVGLEVAGLGDARAGHPEADEAAALPVELEDDPPEAREDVEGVLGRAREEGELVKDTVDLDPRRRGALDGGQEHPAEGIANRQGEAGLERLDDEDAVIRLELLPLMLTGQLDSGGHATSSGHTGGVTDERTL